LDTIKLVVAIYYILCPAEVSTNMARFDGIRYGLQHNTGDFKSLNDYYDFVRSEGFGDEVKRRILIGTYVLSAGYYDAYYAKAIQAREVLRAEFDKIFSQFDIVLSPTSPVMPRKIG
jgi:aspartyl-tRNA(Asn)/glutamyl-tRNA(Gln) amidotransferase subunit A